MFVHRLVTLKTIEEKMLELQRRKGHWRACSIRRPAARSTSPPTTIELAARRCPVPSRARVPLLFTVSCFHGADWASGGLLTAAAATS